MVQTLPKDPQKGPFSHSLVCCKACVHPQYNVNHSMSKRRRIVIIFNLTGIWGATSLHKSILMGNIAQ